MDKAELQAVMEGLIFAAGEEGITAKELADLLAIEKQEVERLIQEMQIQGKEQGRGLQIVKVAQHYVMTTLAEHAPYLEKMAQVPKRTKLSRASLEVLAIVAYCQPITRLEIEEIRGVKSDHLLQSLSRKGLIRVVGRAEGVGRPILYGTTKQFLHYFGLNHLDELPSPHTIFNWKEWEQEKQDLFQRLGVKLEKE